jgi:hypothetical protein
MGSASASLFKLTDQSYLAAWVYAARMCVEQQQEVFAAQQEGRPVKLQVSAPTKYLPGRWNFPFIERKPVPCLQQCQQQCQQHTGRTQVGLSLCVTWEVYSRAT